MGNTSADVSVTASHRRTDYPQGRHLTCRASELYTPVSTLDCDDMALPDVSFSNLIRKGQSYGITRQPNHETTTKGRAG